jgi:curved DNA-binding protein CbpA
MLVNYLVLGLSPEAEDAQIRKRYLELIKQYPPEREAIRFQEITAAYEKIKDESSRIRTQLFEPLNIKDSEKAILGLIQAAPPKRQRIGLKALVAAAKQLK